MRPDIVRSVLFLMFLLTGCASTPKTDVTDEMIAVHNASVAEKDRIVCKMERQTSTYISKRVCRTVAQMEAEEERARELLDRRKGTSGSSMQQ